MSEKKLLILGATGGIGRHLVTQALEAGHHVTALARGTGSFSIQDPKFRPVAADITDERLSLADIVSGHDAVISALGRGKSLASAHLIQHSAPRIVEAMRARRVRRLIFTSAIAVGESIRYAPMFPRIMARVPLRNLYADKAAGEEVIRRSDLDWTLVQPALLTNGPLTRRYRAGEHLDLSGIPKISRADAAHFMLALLDSTAYIRQTLTIAY